MMKYFSGKTVLLATKHGKERVIAPLLKKELGLEVIVPKYFDTDRFGTFTREVKRDGTQREAAYRKAIACMDLYDADFVLASEGSFGTHPAMPFATSNLELLLFLDRNASLEICGQALSADTNMHAQHIRSLEELETLIDQCDFPTHGLIARYHQLLPIGIYKDFSSVNALQERVQKMLALPFVKKLYIETDMRAHRNPTRMKVIEEATHDLVRRLHSACPKCSLPGFVSKSSFGQKTCLSCGTSTDVPAYERLSCDACEYSIQRALGETDVVDPSKCQRCNP